MQHKNFGAVLLKKAESGMKKILVMSTIGTRDYYKRFGYKRVVPYMGKELNRGSPA